VERQTIRESAERSLTAVEPGAVFGVALDSARSALYPRGMSRIVAHVDLDAFFAAVEELERPELAGVPLVVGGDPHGRGVVATANYVARRYGIASAMACAEALRRCPATVFVRPRMGLYREYSAEVWSIVREIVPTIEQAGIDEGYLDLGEVAPVFDDARALAEAVRAVVRARTRLSCSLGLGSSKVVAKIASDRRKPGGLTVVRPGREAAFLAPLPIRVLPGIGPRAEVRLAAAGVDTIGGLARLDDGELARALPGKIGRLVRERARGIDPRPLEVSAERISISSEETFPRDVADPERLHSELRRMAEELASHLRHREQTARTVTTKLRYPDFAIRTRSSSLEVGIDDGDRIGKLACSLLDRALRDRPGPLRLVGVGVSGLTDHAQLELSL
jgi:DNA polymerase-4